MPDLSLAQQACWDLGFGLRILVLCLLLVRGHIRALPLFSLYLVTNLLQTVLLHFTYQYVDPKSMIAFKIAWGSEAVVTCTRAFAVAEICRHLFAGYRGIWSLVWRVLLSCAVLVLAYSALVSNHRWSMVVLGAGRALELSIAAVIVALFVFLRHYQVTPDPTLRALALGFCLYACVAVINYTILESQPNRYLPLWSLLGVVTFLASLSIWTWALRIEVPRPVFNPILLPGSVYRRLSPEINLQLRRLNERLGQFWNVDAPRP
jgi:hypothetical protein